MSLNGTKSEPGARYSDLKARIKELETELRETTETLKNSICPYCNEPRGTNHAWVNGKEVACPKFAGFPEKIRGFQTNARY